MTEPLLSVEEVFRFTQGDKTVLAKILDHRMENLTRYIYTMIEDSAEAEDIAMHAFKATWDARTTLLTSSAIEAYFFTVAKNKANDYIRHEKVKHKHRSAMSHSQQEQEDLSVIKKILDTNAHFVHEILALETLTPQEREVITKYYLEGVPMKELKKLLGVNKNTLTAFKERGLAKIRQYLKLKDLLAIWLILKYFLEIFKNRWD